MKIMFSAGEASGDLHGANLARSLRELDPQIELLGMGGKEMAASGPSWPPHRTAAARCRRLPRRSGPSVPEYSNAT